MASAFGVGQEPLRPVRFRQLWGMARASPFTVGPRIQLSQYGSKPVIILTRDATYVLDAILGNETELAILEHTTDTAEATEIVFALFDLLGLRFTPRLRDIGSRRLYRSGTDRPAQLPPDCNRISRDTSTASECSSGGMTCSSRGLDEAEPCHRVSLGAKDAKRIRSKTPWP